MNLKEKGLFKSPIALITYGILLYFACKNFYIVIHGLYWLLRTLSPLFAAIGLAFVLNLLLLLFENKLFSNILNTPKGKKRKKVLCVTLSYLTLIVGFTLLLTLVIPQLSDSVKMFGKNIPVYQKVLERYIINALSQLNMPNNVYGTLLSNWKEVISKTGDILQNVFNYLFYATRGFTSSIVNAILAFVLSIYMLLDKDRLLRMLRRGVFAFLPSKISFQIMRVFKIANDKFTHFIAGQFTEALIIGTLCFIGMFIFRFPYALLISVIVGITAIIPVFGAILGTIPGAFIILMINPIKALWFILFIIVLQQLEGNLIYPKVVGGSIGLSGFWVLIAMMIGGAMAGFWGILLGIPIFAVIYTLISEATDKQIKKKMPVRHNENKRGSAD